MTGFPSFPDFYRELNGREPFPWQMRLAEMVTQDGWPKAIGVATGLGKTACIDIAVWSLASQSSLSASERTLPTRIWYVVNRRLLIDAAFEHGEILATILAGDSSEQSRPAMAAVGSALRAMGAAGSEIGPLHITRLRGGAEQGARPPDPSQPSIIFATVPMFASRWLFRGYGSSRSMRPVDAALSGLDSLVLLDEAHLARPLASLAEPLRQCDVGDSEEVLPSHRARPRIVALTATGDRDVEDFALDGDDLAHHVITTRLNAPKPVSLVESTEKKIHTTLADQAISLVSGQVDPTTCVVFTNTPKRARAVWNELWRRRKSLPREVDVEDVVLLTGRMRDRESEAARRRVLDPVKGAPSGRDRAARKRDLIVVATQTLEVGADLDFDLLVSETAGVRAIVQRLGRLNRLGESPSAGGAICHPVDAKSWPVYGDEPALVWERLTRSERNGLVDLAPLYINDVLGLPADLPERTGELLPSHLWEWAKTTIPPPGEAPVELFFQGFDESGQARVSMCWRAHLPEDGVRLFPAVTESESIDIPIWEVRETLERRDIEEVRRLASDRASLETVAPDSLRPGDHLVLPVNLGPYDSQGWNSEADEIVLDNSLLRSNVLPLEVDVIRALTRGAGGGAETRSLLARLVSGGTEDEPLERDEERALIDELRTALRGLAPHPWMTGGEWGGFVDGLGSEVERPVGDIPYVSAARRGLRAATVRVAADAFEELSFDIKSATLAAHLGNVGEMAAKMAAAIGLPDDLVEIVGLAGRLHDIGKSDPRFQRWLDPDGRSEEYLAKSDVPWHRIEATRVASGWPRGGRHELLSGRLLAKWLLEHSDPCPDPQLLVHLVLSHHGHGRPTLRVVGDKDGLDLGWGFSDGKQIATSASLSEHDWAQPRRFRDVCERYGYWGVALLEACVRQADQAVSAARGVV